MFGLIIFGLVIYFVIKFVLKKQNEPEDNNIITPKGEKVEKVLFDDVEVFKKTLPDGTIEYSNGSGYYINHYQAFLSNTRELGKECPSTLYKPNKSEVSFYFKENKTKDYHILLELIKDNPTLKKQDNKYQIIFDLKEWEKVKQVYDIVKKWKDTKIFLDGKEIDKLLLSKLLQCLSHKSKSTDKKWCLDFYYDQNYPQCIGCRCLGISTINFDDFIEKKENCFKIKKEEILNQIQNKAKVFKYCPFWNNKIIWENYLKIIPEIKFNDTRFVCIKDEYGYRIEIRTDPYRSLKEVKKYTNGEILSIK